MVNPQRWITGIALLLLASAAGCAIPAHTAEPAPTPIAGETADVLYFWGEGCHACHGATSFVEELGRDHPGVRFETIETYGNATNVSRFYAVNRWLNVTPDGLPEAVADGRAFFGEAAIRNGLPGAIAAIEARR